ncbi:MAG: polyprenyl synthetase family protein [Deltaproteobacteria bacterium]|nr:polyprenyl synthetase family protein [Deltaproteobacteria bacterium]MBW1934878.1 polyprenyl synthetase family protein [Deltaproteobacteria bacterium]MBW1978190.1 polyprenyl synthetase family protein [Deltaproteobacteria bacterium]MBW2044546.1 polyprenyl synthetase family protein [Deltaproteobacteria bacterium]MBW2299107.1 polyprenyl synthetase family protein [Deltaproteobacteria bacterium]
MDLKAYLSEKQMMVDQALREIYPEPQGPAEALIEAMRYSLFAGGKRLRPILCIAAAEAVGGKGPDVLPVACGLELIHTYSLIHDDLPVMDDDDLRRGKPTSHKVFGEAVAVLAGDGLLTEAFRIMSSPEAANRFEPSTLLRVICLIAEAAGYKGMVGGQTADIKLEGKDLEPALVEFIHTHKTGALIRASAASGAILGGGNEEQVKAITSYGESIGLAFQIADDVLDIEGDTKTMGKGVGGDEQKKKITYPGVHGIAKSKEIQKDLVERAIKDLDRFDYRADPLRKIAVYIIERKK